MHWPHPAPRSGSACSVFLADTGAFFPAVSRHVLSVQGARPIRPETVQFADGRTVRWKVGEARLEVDGRSVTTLVLLGRTGSQPLLGAYSLDGLGLSVDWRRGRLLPMPVAIVASSNEGRAMNHRLGARR